MNNKFRIVVKVIYYIFAFSMGLLFAVSLPNWFSYDITMNYIHDALTEENYQDSVSLVGGYYNDEYVYLNTFSENKGIVLFEAVSLTYDSENSSNSETQVHKAYIGYIWGIKDSYDIQSDSENNRTKMVIKNLNDESFNIELLDYDSNNDGIKEDISLLKSKDFFYIDIDYNLVNSLKSITLVDKNGNDYLFFDLSDKNFAYNTSFFNDVNDFVDEYNRDYSSEKLAELDESFRAISPHYQISKSASELTKKALKWSILIILAYFLVIYLIGDIALGKRYTIKGIKWILKKVFKVKFKSEEEKTELERIKELEDQKFGADYYSKVSITLDTTEAEDLTGGVIISYSNEKERIEFNLSKSEDYTQTQRIKAGVYKNPWIEIDPQYEVYELPENLLVEGYARTITIKIKQKNKQMRSDED